ncbi:MAG: rRNA maturation RNase YbeY [Chitinophagaceae bacterium]
MKMNKTGLPGLIRFGFADAQMAFRKKKQIKCVIHQIFKDRDVSLKSLQYVFCSDHSLLDLNRRFLSHDTYTDIITFSLAETGMPIEGEIYISVDRVRENAQSLNIRLQSEVVRVIFHGALHLCGFKDKSAAQKKEMRSQEDKYLSQIQF